MTQKILIAGSGFAGMWAALSAARAVSMAGKTKEFEITVVSPQPNLCVRPRLYETAFAEMTPDIGPLFESVGVRHHPGKVETIAADRHEVEIVGNDGVRVTVSYDRFVLAAGSTLFMPDIPGLKEHSFNVDQLDGALALDQHLRALADKADSAARNTVVVAGGGFTGIETAADMPQRLREILGNDVAIRVVILEQAADIGPDLGPGPRPVISEALTELGVEVMTSSAAAAVDQDGITTADGMRIETHTVVWTAGARANALAAQIEGPRDRFGRLHADRELRALETRDVFVTGDTVMAATDDVGNTTVMSCQHALSLGRVAGHNAAAELLGVATVPYSQPKYVTCLDLGPWGAVYTEGWERDVKMVRDEAKSLKRDINTVWIYPPEPVREAVFAAADPTTVIVP